MNRSIILAILIASAIGVWIWSGDTALTATGSDDSPGQVTLAIGDASVTEPAPSVRVIDSVAQPHVEQIRLRGRSEANRMVHVRSETSGRVTARPVARGAIVNKGDLLCELAVDDRAAQLAETQAELRQMELEYNAARTLAQKGYRAETQASAARAALDAARAGVERMEVEIARTKLTAPFTGVVELTAAEVGDYLQPGGTCASVVDSDPILLVGFLSEREVGHIATGDNASARLVTGELLAGSVRHIATMADAATRTFRIEIAAPNPNRTIRDGVTAEIALETRARDAHRLSPAALTLDDNGRVGVKTVAADGRVRFIAVDVIADSTDGVWVAGLPARTTIITVGQEFVSDGQVVDTTREVAGTTVGSVR